LKRLNLFFFPKHKCPLRQVDMNVVTNLISLLSSPFSADHEAAPDREAVSIVLAVAATRVHQSAPTRAQNAPVHRVAETLVASQSHRNHVTFRAANPWIVPSRVPSVIVVRVAIHVLVRVTVMIKCFANPKRKITFPIKYLVRTFTNQQQQEKHTRIIRYAESFSLSSSFFWCVR
jgi:hypothetical protein